MSCPLVLRSNMSNEAINLLYMLSISEILVRNSSIILIESSLCKFSSVLIRRRSSFILSFIFLSNSSKLRFTLVTIESFGLSYLPIIGSYGEQVLPCSKSYSFERPISDPIMSEKSPSPSYYQRL